MEMLADASVAAAAHDNEAANILQQLCAARHETSETTMSDGEQTTTAHYDVLDTEDSPRPWTREDDELLRRLVVARGGPQVARRGPGKTPTPQLDAREWHEIAEHFDDRSAMQCAHRFQKIVNPDNVKGRKACR